MTIRKGHPTIYPRARHSSVTDGMRYVYLLGCAFATAKNTVERYDVKLDNYTSLP